MNILVAGTREYFNMDIEARLLERVGYRVRREALLGHAFAAWQGARPDWLVIAYPFSSGLTSEENKDLKIFPVVFRPLCVGLILVQRILRVALTLEVK